MSIIGKIYCKLRGDSRHDDRYYSEKVVETIRNQGGGVVGKNLYVYDSNIDFPFSFLLQIGDNVTITHARILLHDASLRRKNGYTKIGTVSIGNNVFIGADSTLLPGISIGDNVVIGAGTVVAKDIPSNSVAIGNPCRILRTYEEFLDREKSNIKSSIVIEKLPDDFTDEEKKQLIKCRVGYCK